jgi:hypothetical protein
MALMLKQLRVGKVDGKHEYLTPLEERDGFVFDAFLMPEAVDPDRMNNADIFFVEGFRGTGKTSLLRWHADKQRKSGATTDFVLFKSDLTEAQRLHISKEVGISWTDLDPKNMEISQDFKAAWTWFILHKIGENILRDTDAYAAASTDLATKVTRLLGLNDESIFRKAIGFMPKLEGAHVKIRGDIGFFEAELGGDFRPDGKQGSTSLGALSSKVIAHLSAMKFAKPIFIYFDELEAFYHTPEQHRRDQRMVRDLLFSVGHMNDSFRKAKAPIHVLAAVRSEVIDSMGALGQEVDRLVHDKGFQISWHHARRSINHPLVQIVRRKLEASELAEGLVPSSDPISEYFPTNINEEPIDQFLLDRSFYKPRDLVWRLSLAQKLFPNDTKFSVQVMRETEIEYSSKLWDEVRYELSATYSETDVDAIESVLAGTSASFELPDIELRFTKAAQYSQALAALLSRKSVRDILADLYRIGAIGNSFRVGTTGTAVRNRWSFRGDPTFLADKRMVIHPALFKRLSVVAVRRRGSRAGDRKWDSQSARSNSK